MTDFDEIYDEIRAASRAAWADVHLPYGGPRTATGEPVACPWAWPPPCPWCNELDAGEPDAAASLP